MLPQLILSGIGAAIQASSVIMHVIAIAILAHNGASTAVATTLPLLLASVAVFTLEVYFLHVMVSHYKKVKEAEKKRKMEPIKA